MPIHAAVSSSMSIERVTVPSAWPVARNLLHLAEDRLPLDRRGHLRPEVSQTVGDIEDAVGVTVERVQVGVDHRALLGRNVPPDAAALVIRCTSSR